MEEICDALNYDFFVSYKQKRLLISASFNYFYYFFTKVNHFSTFFIELFSICGCC